MSESKADHNALTVEHDHVVLPWLAVLPNIAEHDPEAEPVIGYYLGDVVELLRDHDDGWVSARFADDRKKKEWRMWRSQIKVSPWGDKALQRGAAA